MESIPRKDINFLEGSVKPSSDLASEQQIPLLKQPKALMTKVSGKLAKKAINEAFDAIIKHENSLIKLEKYPHLYQRATEILGDVRGAGISKVSQTVQERLNLVAKKDKAEHEAPPHLTQVEINALFDHLTDEIKEIIEYKKCPKISEFLNALIAHERNEGKQIDLVVRLISSLKGGFVDFNILMNLENVHLSNEVIAEFRQFELSRPSAGLTSRIYRIANPAKYPDLNKFLTTLRLLSSMDKSQAGLVLNLIDQLEKGCVGDALEPFEDLIDTHVADDLNRFRLANLDRLIADKIIEVPVLKDIMSVTADLAKEKIDKLADKSFRACSQQIEGSVDGNSYPNLQNFLYALNNLIHSNAFQTSKKLANNTDNLLFSLIDDLSNNGIFDQLTKLDQSTIGKIIEPKVLKDVMSITAGLAKKQTDELIAKSFERCSKEIEILIDGEKHAHLKEFLHGLNHIIHSSIFETSNSLENNKDNFLFDFIDDLNNNRAFNQFKKLSEIENLPPKVLQDVMDIAINAGGKVGESKLKSFITSTLQKAFQEEGEVWTDQVVEGVNTRVSALIQGFQDGVKQAMRGGKQAQSDLGSHIAASWALVERWDSSAHLVFVNPESGADMAARVLAALVIRDGGVVSATGTEVLMTLIPERLHKSKMSQQIAATIDVIATPARHLSGALDGALSVSEKNKKLALQGGSAFLLGGHGLMGNYSAPVVAQAVGSVAGYFRIADPKHFGSPAEFFSEDTFIKLGAGAFTTGAVEGYIRPTMGDGVASFTYMTSNALTTVGMPTIKESWVWKKVKTGTYHLGVGAINYFLGINHESKGNKDS